MLIQNDNFPFEFISVIAERESWRKEVHRPIYHIHKWWAKRLGSVFRGILLGSILPDNAVLEREFYKIHNIPNLRVFDPFMGSGTTIGEAHKLGFTAFGMDINPIASEIVRVALGPLNERNLLDAFNELCEKVKPQIREFYTTVDGNGHPATILYYFWVMQSQCENCDASVDLFSSYIISQNAYPKKKPATQVLCPKCGEIFRADYNDETVCCSFCEHQFNPRLGPVVRSKFTCTSCNSNNNVTSFIRSSNSRPDFRLYGKLILNTSGKKEYLKATAEDLSRFEQASKQLNELELQGKIRLPDATLDDGYNTNQALNYNFRRWRDFFNDRQLLVLSILHKAIVAIADKNSRDALLTLFSSTLEFNNLFTSYKGEGTGAVRHMFAHHILKPERTPIETNIWGTDKSSGSFSGLFKTKLLRAVKYRAAPSEVKSNGQMQPTIAALPITGNLAEWPVDGLIADSAVHLKCGDSSFTNLPENSIDLVVTDPPFFDNVHYSELADFFYAWQVLHPRGFIKDGTSTRQIGEVQDGNVKSFTEKLNAVLSECHRVLKETGMLIFSYHHSREEGWTSVAEALDRAGFFVVNAHPVKAEMSGAKPKSQAKSPIQLDIIVVCQKKLGNNMIFVSKEEADDRAQNKIQRLQDVGFLLSDNDKRIIIFGQYLCTDYFFDKIKA